MKRLLRWLSRRGRAARAPRSPRLELERLDERLLPSATSALTTHAPWGPTWYHLFAIDRTTQQVVEFSTSSWGTQRAALGGPQVSDVSASIDPRTGGVEVFALGLDHHAYRGDSSGNWTMLDADSYSAISAARDGQAYAVKSDGSNVRLFTAGGSFTDLGAPVGGVLKQSDSPISASVGWFGRDEVFAIGSDGHIYLNSDNAPGSWRVVDNRAGITFTTLSASPDDQVFALDKAGQLYQETEHFLSSGRYGAWYWSGQNISPKLVFTSISADLDASGHGEVYALRGTGWVFHYDQGNWSARMDAGVAEVAGADGGYFFDVHTDGTAWAFNPFSAAPWLVGNNVR